MIDFHTHPLLVREMWEKHPDLRRITREIFFLNSAPQPLEVFLRELHVAGLERAVLLPIDVSTTKGCQIYSNAQIAELCQMSDRFVGFASVDPHREDAANELEHAIKHLGLRGLKLVPPSQEFYPNDQKLAYPIYERAQNLGVPIVFHAGMSWEPHAKAKYGSPMHLEDVACDFPGLNIVIAHLGWPWVEEAVMLAIKYPSVYLDTAALYFDNPWEFLTFVMTKRLPLTLFERSLRHKLIFGSNYPRAEIRSMAKAIRELGLCADCLELVFAGNAERILGGRGREPLKQAVDSGTLRNGNR